MIEQKDIVLTTDKKDVVSGPNRHDRRKNAVLERNKEKNQKKAKLIDQHRKEAFERALNTKNKEGNAHAKALNRAAEREKLSTKVS